MAVVSIDNTTEKEAISMEIRTVAEEVCRVPAHFL